MSPGALAAVLAALLALAVFSVRAWPRSTSENPIGPSARRCVRRLDFVFWQVLTRAFDVPQVLLPAPSLIGRALVTHFSVLLSDFNQTVLHSVLIGLVVGCALGFAIGVLIDRSPFLQRGLLPIAALASTVPLIGIAPIMVMWFGFDGTRRPRSSSMTFFQMLVKTRLRARRIGHMERDLMRCTARLRAHALAAHPVALRSSSTH